MNPATRAAVVRGFWGLRCGAQGQERAPALAAGHTMLMGRLRRAPLSRCLLHLLTGPGRDETMARYIHMTVLTGNLIGTMAGIDEDISARRYVELLRARLRQAYPDAETDIRLAFATGVAPPTRVILGHEEDVEAAREVDALAAALRASGEWAVSAS